MSRQSFCKSSKWFTVLVVSVAACSGPAAPEKRADVAVVGAQLGVFGGDVAVPINPSRVDSTTGAPLSGYLVWDGTFAELLAADAYARCAYHASVFAPAGPFEENLIAKISSAMGATGATATCPSLVSAQDCSGHSSSSLCTLENWQAFRADPKCNVLPGTTTPSGVDMTVVSVPSNYHGDLNPTTLLPLTIGAFAQQCVAAQLNEAESSALVAVISPDNRLQLNAIMRDRAVRASAFLSWYIKALATASAGGSGTNEDLIASVQSANSDFHDLGDNYIALQQLIIDSTERLVEVLWREPGAQSEFGSLEDVGGKLVAHGPRALAYEALFGERAPLPPVHGLPDPEGRLLLDLARTFDVLTLDLTLDGTDHLLSVEENAQQLYQAIEDALQTQKCGSPACVSPLPTLLFGTYSLTVEHGRQLVQALAELAFGRGRGETRQDGAGFPILVYPAPTEDDAGNPITEVVYRLTGRHRITGLDDGSRTGNISVTLDKAFAPSGTSVGNVEIRPVQVDDGAGGLEPLPTMYDGVDTAGALSYPVWWSGSDWLLSSGNFGTLPIVAAGTTPVLVEAFEVFSAINNNASAAGLRDKLFDDVQGGGPSQRASLALDLLRGVLGERFLVSSPTDLRYYGPEPFVGFAATTSLQVPAAADETCDLQSAGSCQPTSGGSLGWYWGVGATSSDTLDSIVHFSAVSHASSAGQMREGATLTGGRLLGLARRLFAYQGSDWSRPQYDGLGMNTGEVPVGDARLYGGPEGQPAYQYFLDMSKEAARNASTEMQDVFDELRKQASDQAELARSEAAAEAAEARELAELCGDGDCSVGETDVSLVMPTCVPAEGRRGGMCTSPRLLFTQALGGDLSLRVSAPVADGFDPLRGEPPQAVAALAGSAFGEAIMEEWRALMALQRSLIQAVQTHNASLAAETQANKEEQASLEEHEAKKGELSLLRQEIELEFVRKLTEGLIVAPAQIMRLQAERDQFAAQEATLNADLQKLEHDANLKNEFGPCGRDTFERAVDASNSMSDSYRTIRNGALYTKRGDNALNSYSHAPVAQYWTNCNEARTRWWFARRPLIERRDAAKAQKEAADAQITALKISTLGNLLIDGVLKEGKLAQVDREEESASARRTAAQTRLPRVELETTAQLVTQFGLLQDAVGNYYRARYRVAHVRERAAAAQEQMALAQSRDRAAYQARMGLSRAFAATEMARANALDLGARRMAATARRAVEAHFVTHLDELSQEEPFVEAPSRWVDLIAQARLELADPEGGSGDLPTYGQDIVDYVSKLEQFVSGYALRRPVASANDVEVLQIPAPLASNTIVGRTGRAYTVADGASVGWSFWCPEAGTWVVVPPRQWEETGDSWQDACGGPRPTMARYGFWLDAWGRMRGSDRVRPIRLRHNVRWGRMAINLVGSGIRDCSRANDPEACYAEPYLRFDMRHVGPSFTRGFDEEWRFLPFPAANIEGAKALAAEEWVDAVSRGFATPEVAAIARQEYVGRPVGGAYELVVHLPDDLRLERLERIQLLLENEYWVRQGDVPDPGGDSDAICGDGVLNTQAGEVCETPQDGQIVEASSGTVLGAAFACPTSCDDGDPSTSEQMLGDPRTCTAECTAPEPIETCSSEPDGWCPLACTAQSDADCASGPVVSWRGQAVASAAPPSFIWHDSEAKLVGKTDPLSGQVQPFGPGDVPTVALDGRNYVLVEGPRTHYLADSDVSAWDATGPDAPVVQPSGFLGIDGNEAPMVTFVNSGDGQLEASVLDNPMGDWVASVFVRPVDANLGWRLAWGGASSTWWPAGTGEWVRRSISRTSDPTSLAFTERSWLASGTETYAFDVAQVESGAFPSSPFPMAGATEPVERPGYSLTIPSASLHPRIFNGSWNTVIVPEHADTDTLDGNVTESHFLTFVDSARTTGVAWMLARAQGLRVVEIGDPDMDGSAGEVLVDIDLEWDRNEAIQLVVTSGEDGRVAVLNGDGEPLGIVRASLPTGTDWDLIVGTDHHGDNPFFGLVAELHASRYDSFINPGVSGHLLCGNGLFEPAFESCDSTAGGEHVCPYSYAFCRDQDVCTVDRLEVGSTDCSAVCVHERIVECVGGDGCCPSGCVAGDDSDCQAPLVSWDDGVRVPSTLERYAWLPSVSGDPGGHQLFGPFTADQPALVAADSGRYVQVEGSRTNLFTHNRDTRAWVGPSAADYPFPGVDKRVVFPQAFDFATKTFDNLPVGPLSVSFFTQTSDWFDTRVFSVQDEVLVEWRAPSGSQMDWTRLDGKWEPAGDTALHFLFWDQMFAIGYGTVDLLQVEEAAFPSSPIPTGPVPEARPADDFWVPAAAVSQGLRDGRWEVFLIPEYSSGELADHSEDATILAFNQAGNSSELSHALVLRSTGALEVHDYEASPSTLLTTGALTWERHARLSVVVDSIGGAVTLKGFTSGDGYHDGAPWSVPIDTDLRVGSKDQSEYFFGLISEPREVPFAQGNAPYCGDSIVEGVETCDTDCAPAAIAAPDLVAWTQACADAIDGVAGDPDQACCDDLDVCTVGDHYVSGDIGSCSLLCSNVATITACNHNDGCCPAGCTPVSDHDCTMEPTELFGSNLITWFRADQGLVFDGSSLISEWQDLSGNGIDVAQPDTTRRPVLRATGGPNGTPCVYFEYDPAVSKTSSLYRYGTAPASTNPQVYTVLKYDTLSSNETRGAWHFDGWLEQGTPEDSASLMLYTNGLASVDYWRQVLHGPQASAYEPGPSPSADYTQWHLIASGLSGSHSHFRVNGQPGFVYDSLGSGYEHQSYTQRQLVVGSRADVTGWGSDACIAEFIFFDGAPTANEEQSLRLYLNARYNQSW